MEAKVNRDLHTLDQLFKENPILLKQKISKRNEVNRLNKQHLLIKKEYLRKLPINLILTFSKS